MATENLQIPDIASNQNQKEVTANAATNLLDRAMNNNVQKAITVATSFTTTEARENFVIELTGTPGAPINIDMPDTNNRTLAVVNNTDDVMTIRNSASGGTGQPVIAVGEASVFHYDGTNFFDLSALALPTVGYMPLPLGTLRDIAANEIAGPLDDTTTPEFARINGATDKGLRVLWVTGNLDEVAFPERYMPPDIDADKDLTIHLVGEMSGGTDTTTSIDVQVFDSSGDTEMGGSTGNFTSTRAEYTVTIAAADLVGHPLGWLSISLVPVGAHGTDTLQISSAWIEYARKVA